MSGDFSEMKKRYKFLITFLVIISLCAGLIWWQFGNVRALYYWLKYSESDIDTMMNENSAQVETYLEENSSFQVRPSKPVEEELHKKGVIDDKELVNLITEQTTIKDMFGTELELSEEKNITIVESGEKIEDETLTQLKQDVASSLEVTQQDGNNDGTNSDAGKKNEDSPKPQSSEISECIAQVYVIKAKFVGELDVIYNKAFSEYKVLWRDMTDEQRTAKKKALLAEVYPRAAALERDCDNQINQLLSKLTKLLEDSGESTALTEQIRTAYYNEKSLKKAHYLSLIT